MIILDTCTLIWLAVDQKKLSLKARKMIEQNPDSLFVSAITAFEIAIRCRNGKLTLPLPPLEWFAQVVEFHGIKELFITSSIAIESAQLPKMHNDLSDRIIIATAQANNMKILTCDEMIAQYKDTEVIW